MSVWNKVLLVLIFLGVAGFVFFGANALKMRRDSQKKLADAHKSLEEENNKYQQVLYGSGQGDGHVFLVKDVGRLRNFRGTRAWPDCLPHAQAIVKNDTVTLQLVVDAQPEKKSTDDLQEPAPSTDSGNGAEAASTIVPPQERILPGTVVYLFDKRAIADGGALLGEFKVAKVENNIATLTNAYLMTPAEIQRINDSVAQLAPWAVYTALPRKDAAIVANSDSAEQSTGAESGNDGDSDESLAQSPSEKFSDPTDDPRSVLGQTFASLNHKRMLLRKHVQMLEMQLAALKTSDVEAKTMVEFYHKEIETTQASLQESNRQLAEVNKLYDATMAESKNLEELIANVKQLNKKMLADLTKAQLNASQIINERDASLSMSR